VGSLGPLMLLGYFLTPAEERGRNDELVILALSIIFIIGLGWFFTLRSGKKEYERLKHKSVN